MHHEYIVFTPTNTPSNTPPTHPLIHHQHPNTPPPPPSKHHQYTLQFTTNTPSLGVDALKIGDEAMLELLAHLISEPAFDQLRTKEQLGYIVHTGSLFPLLVEYSELL